MRSNSDSTAGGGIGFTGLLQVALIVLKLCKVIDWPWLIVLLPMIITCGLGLIIILVCLVILYFQHKNQGGRK
jgi:ABC-type nickel/cobalt efflux system permease component RcnA